MDGRETVLLGEKLRWVSSLYILCLGESCLIDLVCFFALRAHDFLLRVDGVSGSSWPDFLFFEGFLCAFVHLLIRT